jgi:hypothetical protein
MNKLRGPVVWSCCGVRRCPVVSTSPRRVICVKDKLFCGPAPLESLTSENFVELEARRKRRRAVAAVSDDDD